ncbi:prephenate dehydratase [Bifidobacterium thermophilum]|uniref:prephenate dehydratase n=1 Tax=Bifidobacterium thermophilum TaxID=33905 RepID=UPI0030B4C167
MSYATDQSNRPAAHDARGSAVSQSRTNLYYLGPQGSFTHQAAVSASHALAGLSAGIVPTAESTVPEIMTHVRDGDGWGVIAWENNVEGYVVPNLDMMIDADDVVGFAHVGVDVAFDAFVPSGSLDRGVTPGEATAHPHGLAQCQRFIARHHLALMPATSNAAACRDVRDGQVALGPSICGELYHLDTLERDVQDYHGARTEFLVLARRDDAPALMAHAKADGHTEFETIIAFIPLSTGPGVLANLLDVLRDAGLNMTSFISRPIKGHAGTYSFVAAVDAAPWQPHFRSVLAEVVEHGDWVKTLAVYPRRERPNPPVNEWMLPQGGVCFDPHAIPDAWDTGADAARELLW